MSDLWPLWSNKKSVYWIQSRNELTLFDLIWPESTEILPLRFWQLHLQLEVDLSFVCQTSDFELFDMEPLKLLTWTCIFDLLMTLALMVVDFGKHDQIFDTSNLSSAPTPPFLATDAQHHVVGFGEVFKTNQMCYFLAFQKPTLNFQIHLKWIRICWYQARF